jgi:hypothetical protein
MKRPSSIVDGFWIVSAALAEIEHQVKRCAESLVSLDVALDHVETQLSIGEGD